MLKRNAFLRILLVALLAIGFLLMIGKSVQAAETTPENWVIKIGDETTGYEDDSIDLIDDESGDWVKGKSLSIKWKLTVLEEDDGSAGTASLELTNLNTLSGAIQIPNKIIVERRAESGKYVYNITELKSTSFQNANKITTIKLNSCLSNIDVKAFEDCIVLEKFEVENGNTTFYADKGVLYKKDGNDKVLVKFPIAKSTSGIAILNDTTKIGDYAFSKNTTKDVKINIPQNVTTIGAYSFYNFDGLKVIEFEKEENIKAIGNNAFENCTSLVKFPKLSNITNIPDEAFYNCENLDEILLGDNVVTIGHRAFHSTKISQIKLPSKLEGIGNYAFRHTLLKEAEVQNVKQFGEGVFADCKELEKVVLSDTLTVITKGLFYNCVKLKNVNMPKDLIGISDLAFYKTSISNIEIPEKVTLVGYAAFFECPNLTSVVVPASLSQVGEEIFFDDEVKCNQNLVIYCTADNKIISEAPAYIVYEKAPAEGTKDHIVLNSFIDVKGNVTQINLLNEIYGLPVTVIGKDLFKDNTKLTQVTMPDSITEIGESAFAGCKGLTEILLSKNLKSIGDYAFSNCTGLKTIIVQKGTPIESIGKEAFANCTATLYYDGNNTVINGYDKVANKTNINLVVDKTPPTATTGIDALPGKYYVAITIKNMKDNASGVYKYVITDKADPQTIPEAEWKLITTDVITEDVKENGIKYIYIMDRAGNIAKYEKNIEGVDTTKPQIGEYKKIGGKFATIKVEVSEEEKGSGLDNYCVQMSNTVPNETATWTVINTSELKYTLEVTIKSIGTWYLFVKDKAGNISEPKEIVLNNTDIDSLAPIVDTVSYNFKRDNEKNIVYAEEVEYSITDLGIGLAAYAIDTNAKADENTRWISIEGEENPYTFEHTYVANNVYYIHAKDIYGNISDTEYTEDKIEGDLVAPIIEFGNRKDDKIEVIISDLYSGVASGADIGYAWSTSNTEEPSSYTTVTLTYTNADKEVTFNVDGNSLTGTYYLWVKIGTLKDTLGNEIKDGKATSVAYEFDNTAPKIVNIQKDRVAVQEGVVVTYTITISEEVTLNENIKATIQDNELGTLSEIIGSGTEWTINFTAGKKDGKVKLNIPKELFKDNFDNVLDRDYCIEDVRVDNTNPEMPAPVLSREKVANGVEAVYTFKIEEKLTIVESQKSNLTLTGTGLTGTVKDIRASVDGTEWIVTVKGGQGNGEVTLNLPKGLFVDEAGNESNAQGITGLSFDNVMPTATLQGPDVTLMSKDGTAVFTMTASEKIKVNIENNIELVGVNSTDIIESATIETVEKSEDGTTWEIKVSNALGNGQSKLVIPEGTFTDEAGNELALIEKEGLRIDNKAPQIISVSEPVLSADEKSASFIITTEEKEYKYAISANETVDKITEGWKEVTATTIEATVKSNGNFYVYVKDEIGNVTRYESAVTVIGVMDDIAPTIKVEAPTPSVIKAGQTATYKITTSEAVTKADGIEAIVTGEDNHVDLTGDKTNWFATVTAGSVDGEVELTLPKGIFKDTSNNSSVNDVKKAGLTIDNTIPEITVKYEQRENGIKVIVIADEKLSELEGWTLTKTNKDNDTLTKDVTEDLESIVIKDLAGNEIELTLNVKFAESINIAATETVDINQAKKLELTTTPVDVIPETIKWTSSDPSKVTVDGNGKIKGIATGTAIITAVSVIDSNIKGTCEVTVSENEYIPLKGIAFEKGSTQIAEGYDETLKVVFTPSNATNKNVTFTSSDSSVAVVDENGKITALAVGKTKITATFIENEVTGFAECEVTVVEAVPVTSIELDSTTMELNAGESKTLTVTVNPSNATNKKVTWSSTNEKVATVNNNGKVTAIAGGTTTIIATSVENSEVTESCVVTVIENKAVESVSLSPKTVDIIKNCDTILVATINPSNATNKKVTWSSDDETVATVVETEPGYATVTGLKEGTATITVTTEDGNKTDKCTVTVIAGEQKATGFKVNANYKMKIVEGVTYLLGIEPETTISDILAKVEEGYTAEVEDSEGIEITDSTEFVATDKVRIVVTKGTETITYIAVVKGDCTGDGKVTASDLIGAVRQYKYVKSEGTKGENLTGAKLLAIKFTETKDYTARDLIGEVGMYKQWKNK